MQLIIRVTDNYSICDTCQKLKNSQVGSQTWIHLYYNESNLSKDLRQSLESAVTATIFRFT